MPQTFNSPGFYDREIDLSAKTSQPTGIPYVIVGASEKGPAFVPRSFASMDDFSPVFGDLDPKFMAPYGVDKTTEQGRAALFLRVLGAGANKTAADIEATRTKGVVKNAGMKVVGTPTPDFRHQGTVQFLVAQHAVTGSEAYGFPTMFTDNDSYAMDSNLVYLLRGVLFSTNDARFMVQDFSETYSDYMDDACTGELSTTSLLYKKFKLVLSSSNPSFATTDGLHGIKAMTASFDPSDNDYFGKILNTDPEKFETEKHLLFNDFAVDAELASLSLSAMFGTNNIVLLSGSSNTSTTSGDSSLVFRDAFGSFNTRYTSPKTTKFISQPFGSTEYDLFHVEAIDDGEVATTEYKVSISNLKLSLDPKYSFGTFTLSLRDFNDTDLNTKVLEQYNNLTLDPNSDTYIAKVIGDKKTFYNFDVENEDDRRLIVTGKYGNKSKRIRIVVSSDVENRRIPSQCLPFGFRGPNVLNVNNALIDNTDASLSPRVGASGSFTYRMSGSIVPPLPMRFKQTRGEVSNNPSFTGHPGTTEITDSRLFWGVKFERNTNVTNPNISNEKNGIVKAYAKFQGIEKLDVLVTGSYCDTFNNNKFSLAKVALSAKVASNLTGSTEQIMKEAAYIRNATFDSDLKIVDGAWGNRISFGTLISSGGYTDATNATVFNRFSEYAKFSTFLQGGWDGVNIFDKSAKRFNDRATSTESSSIGYGNAASAYTSPGASTNYSGTGIDNNAIASFRTAIDILSDARINNGNVLSIPGIRDSLVVDYAEEAMQSKHQMCFYTSDVCYYDFNTVRIFDGETGRFVDVEKTAETFDGLTTDKDATAMYFPNVVLMDGINNRKVTVPASIAALSALAYNDKVAYPWWAPAGFNRGSLNWVKGTQVKVNTKDREKLYSSRINPIVKIPNENYVIFSQKTLKMGNSALDSINVKRMVLEVKRQIVDIALKTIWEQITPDLYDKFTQSASSRLATIQVKQGIEKFSVICNQTNNGPNEVNNNKVVGRILLVPTRAIEFIAIDFIVTRSGVEFV